MKRVGLIRSVVRPGKRCDLVYGLGYSLPGSDALNRLYVSARVYPPGMSEVYYQEYSSRPTVKPDIGPDIFWLKDLEMIVWGFPNDPELLALPTLYDAQSLLNVLRQRGVNGWFPSREAIERTETRVVKYVPQGRCTLRYRIELKPDRSAGGETVVLFAKIFQPKICAGTTYRIIEALYDSPLQKEGIWRIPRPLHLDERGNWFLVAGLAGEHIEPQGLDKDLLDLVQRCALGLAFLQQNKLPLSEVRRPAAELAGFQKSLHGLRKAKPELSRALEQIEKQVIERMRHSSADPLVPNHGAFRLTQVLVHPSGPGLVDFDGMVLAHPLSDVASFMAHLFYLQAKGVLGPDEASSLNRRFLQTYCGQVPWEVELNQLAPWIAMQLVGKHAKKLIKKASADGQLCRRLILLACELLGHPGGLAA